MSYPPVITIDGPAASGKTTVGFEFAQRLGYLFLDTGCMYRAVTWAALEQNIDLRDAEAVVHLAQTLDMEITPPTGTDSDQQYLVFIDGHDVTRALRSPAVDGNVSIVAAIGGVREEMVARQRLIGHKGQVVMVGRDIGTVVMPDAPLKLYITASPEARAQRRLKDRVSQGVDAEYGEILSDINRRDKIDSGRAHSPLRPAADAIMIDTSEMDQAEVLALLLERLESTPRP